MFFVVVYCFIQATKVMRVSFLLVGVCGYISLGKVAISHCKGSPRATKGHRSDWGVVCLISSKTNLAFR